MPRTEAGRALVRRFGPGLSQRQLVEADVSAVEREALALARAAVLGVDDWYGIRGEALDDALAAIDALMEDE